MKKKFQLVINVDVESDEDVVLFLNSDRQGVHIWPAGDAIIKANPDKSYYLDIRTKRQFDFETLL